VIHALVMEKLKCLEGTEAGLLNKRSSLAPALGVNKFLIVTDIILG
jgi:hypothetical protein